jgi:hypothetical protein
MSTVGDVFTQALALPARERSALAQQLLCSLEAEDTDAEEASAEEIQARSDAVHSGNYVAHDWREALEDIRRELREEDPGNDTRVMLVV